MNILIIGSGGREHALGWKIAQSKKLNRLYFAPGNAGTSELGTNLDAGVSDFKKIKSVVLDNQIDLMVIGPEVPLVEGLHDFFSNDPDLNSVKVVGPKKNGAMLDEAKISPKIL